MSQTAIRGKQILDGSVQRADLDISTVGSAVITKALAGSGITITGTGADAGTGDVTINSSAAIYSASIPFTDGDSLRRTTIINPAVSPTSKITGLIRRPDSIDDSQDKGYLYLCNIVKVTSGSFDLLTCASAWGTDDPTLNPPNETISFNYSIG